MDASNLEMPNLYLLFLDLYRLCIQYSPIKIVLFSYYIGIIPDFLG
jgi:hypothetical protein